MPAIHLSKSISGARPVAMPHSAEPSIPTLAIVGVGLIGGSIGLAARKAGLVGRVLGVGRQQQSLDEALAMGCIDEGLLDPAAALRRSSLVVFCTPVDRIVSQVLELAPVCQPGTLLTDAGSTKGMIVRGIEGHLPDGVAFVGSHPLAGSERRGPRFADAGLFQNRLTVVTRTPQTDPAALAQIAGFWQRLGSRVRIMEPEAHDRALALTSHLPHLLASALAGILPDDLRELTATGFRDTTRIAAGDPALWTGIFLQNREAVIEALDLLLARLTLLRQAMEKDHRATLDDLLTQGKRTRDALGS
jgi:prephenate dehydrogenase